MSYLKKVINTVKQESSKSFTNAVLWSDGMGYIVLVYNEGHRGKVPMDDVGRTIKNIIFRKVNSGQIVVHTPKKFSDAAMKFVSSIITMYLLKLDEIVSPESIHQAPSIPENFQSTNLFNRSMTEKIAE